LLARVPAYRYLLAADDPSDEGWPAWQDEEDGRLLDRAAEELATL
jgi:hypothetical protein